MKRQTFPGILPFLFMAVMMVFLTLLAVVHIVGWLPVLLLAGERAAYATYLRARYIYELDDDYSYHRALEKWDRRHERFFE